MRRYPALILGATILLLLAWDTSFSQQPQPAPPKPALAKDPGPFAPGFGAEPTLSGGQRGKQARPVGGPAPHLPDGRPDFGGDGAWYPGFNGNIAEKQWKGVKSADEHVDVPFLPWSLEVFNQRVENLAKEDPEAQCLPVGIPRYMFDPYPFEMLQTGDRVIFLFEGDNYLFRIIPATHTKNLKPTWMGDAAGHYEGDTLVVDVIGFNNKSWLDQAGHPHSDRMHLTERYTRTDSLTMKYEVLIDDPGAYSKPWTAKNTVPFRSGLKLGESICQENEKDSAHMRGLAK